MEAEDVTWTRARLPLPKTGAHFLLRGGCGQSGPPVAGDWWEDVTERECGFRGKVLGRDGTQRFKGSTIH